MQKPFYIFQELGYLYPAMFRNLKLSTKFNLAVGSIIFVFCLAFSFLLYHHLKERAVEEANDKTRIILEQVDAVGSYVREELRPKMFEILSNSPNQDDFVVEAMSTTHVRCSVMSRFEKGQHYIYKRVSPNPHNPKNRADEFHEKMIGYFRKNGNLSPWNGMVTIQDRQYLMAARPVIVEKGCPQCHGDPSRAPRGLVKLYGSKAGFGWEEGDVIGVESIAIPLQAVFGEIKGIALSSLIFGLGTLAFLFIALQDAFATLVSKPLRKLTKVFEGIAKGTESLALKLPKVKNDEIGELTASFNLMTKHLSSAQEKLKSHAETLRSIFEGITDPLALISDNCSPEMKNRAYQEWTVKGIKAIFAETCKNRDDGLNGRCTGCLVKKAKEEKRGVSESLEEDGKLYHSHVYPIFDDGGYVIKLVHYVRDVTDRREMEEKMRRAEKLAVMGQLAAGIAHEINNPLGGIKLCFNNLMHTEMDEKTGQMHVEVINSGLERMQSIVQQLLDFSKKSSLSISSASINHLIENVLRLVEHLVSKKGIKVIKNLSPRIQPLQVDPDKIEEVFLNITLNAIQAMDENPGTLAIHTAQTDGYCEASFADTGPGIPSEVQPFIFDPFFTTKSATSGTGLGLSVSKSIIEQHAGEILVDTSAKGARFTVRLPLRT